MTDAKTREKVRENRSRRAAERQGYQLHKSPRRDPRALDYGLWWIQNTSTGEWISDEGKTLAEVERWLKRGIRKGGKR